MAVTVAVDDFDRCLECGSPAPRDGRRICSGCAETWQRGDRSSVVIETVLASRKPVEPRKEESRGERRRLDWE